MAVTKNKSEQIKENESGKMISSLDNARVRLMGFDFRQGTTAGADGSTADLVSLPARCKVVPTLSRLTSSALGATLNVGLRAHTNADGTAVAEDDDALSSALAVTTAASVTLNVEGYVDVDSKSNVIVFAKGTLPANATLSGYIAYLAD